MKEYTFILTLELSDPGNEKQMKHVEGNILDVLKKADEEGKLLLDLELNTVDKIVIETQIPGSSLQRANKLCFPNPMELQGHFKPDAQ